MVGLYIEAVILGLSTGTYCAMYCGPVLIPFLFGTNKISCRRNAGLVGTFLASRLLMYFVLGAVLAGAGLLVSEFFDPVFARRLSVFAYMICGTSLILNSLGVNFPWSKGEEGCRVKSLHRVGNDWVTAAVTGLAVGMHICPPLWTAIVRSVFGGHGVPGFFYFIFFYIGSIPFFLPLLGIPFITKRVPAIRRVARITQFLSGIYLVVMLGVIPFFFSA